MSTKLNETQLIAAHLIASGVKGSIIAKQLGLRKETLSRWRQIDKFNKAVEDATEFILREIIDTVRIIVTDSICNVCETIQNKRDNRWYKKTFKWIKNI